MVVVLFLLHVFGSNLELFLLHIFGSSVGFFSSINLTIFDKLWSRHWRHDLPLWLYFCVCCIFGSNVELFSSINLTSIYKPWCRHGRHDLPLRLSFAQVETFHRTQSLLVGAAPSTDAAWKTTTTFNFISCFKHFIYFWLSYFFSFANILSSTCRRGLNPQPPGYKSSISNTRPYLPNTSNISLLQLKWIKSPIVTNRVFRLYTSWMLLLHVNWQTRYYFKLGTKILWFFFFFYLNSFLKLMLCLQRLFVYRHIFP